MQVINPAFVGSKADLSISLLSRQQWAGIEGSPETKTFSINSRIADGFGFGVTLVNDKLGLANSNNVNIDASYTLPLSRYERLSFGLKGGVTFFNNNYAGGVTPDNEMYASTDGTYPNVGFGALYYTEFFYLGLSIPNILKSSQFKTLENLENNFGINTHNYFFTGGYIHEVSENLKFKPSTIIKYTPSLPVSVDLNANVFYKNKIEGGLSYRYKESIGALFALVINKKYRVGYSYENRLVKYGSNLSSHEIIVSFDLDLKRNTRWLFHNRCYF